MQIIESFVRNPVKVAVGVILVTLFGVIAIRAMPIQLTPEVQIPTLTIETRWPGASPQEVEREIILEQEEQLQSVEGVRKMTSESMDSNGKITLEFAIGTDLREALTMVNTRLQQVREYPENADEPVISTSNSSDRPIAWFILSQNPPSDQALADFAAAHPELAERIRLIREVQNPGLLLYRLRELAKEHPEAASLLPPDRDVTKERRFAEDFIEARFERVDGVSNSNVLGGMEEEMQVIVDPERLAARQLTIADVRNALRGHNKDTSAGDFWEGKRRWVVRTTGQFRSEEQVASVILATRDSKPVFVRDVAEVVLGYKKPDGMVRRFGTSVIAINVMRETGSNVLYVMDGLAEAMDELNENLLHRRGLHLAQVYDET
ncbi:MAG: efflux RND transporter permease subunit, partial [Pirellulaceae bacterium]